MEENHQKNDKVPEYDRKNDLFVQVMSAFMLLIFFTADIMGMVHLEHKDMYYSALFVTAVTGKSGLTNIIKSIPIKIGK